MATILGRLFGGRSARQLTEVSNQLAEMRSTVQNLEQYSNQLNSLLAVTFRQQNGFARFDTNQQINYIRNGYNISSSVYAIVSDIAQKGAAIPLKCYEVIDDTALKNYKIANSLPRTAENVYAAGKLKTKALRETDPDNPIQKLIDNPNNDDNATTFYETSIGFTLLCGNNYWYSPRLDMGADKGKITELRLMPSQFVGLVVVIGFPTRVIGYELIVDGVRLMQSQDVIHMRYPNYDYSIDGMQLYGLPPLRAALNTLRRANSAETASLSMFENGGPRMIIANKTLSADNMGLEQAGKLKKMWNDEYSGPTNRNKIKLSPGDISAIPLDMSPVDLDILKAELQSFDMLCNVFHVSSVMYNNHDGNTESNVKEMRKDSWTRGVLPLRRMHADAFNRTIVPAYATKGKKFYVDMDISGITELQPDMQTMSVWLNTAWWVAPNEKRKIQDFDESADPNMNKIWLPSGYQLMDDATINVDDLPDFDDTTPTNEDVENE